MNSMKPTPIVILLDVDGTIVGNVEHQVAMYDIISTMKKKKVKIPYVQRDMHEALQFNGLARPSFRCFIDDLESNNIEVFIYTAAEKTWAEHIVKNLEAAFNIKINRPIFNRSHCVTINNQIMKSIQKVTPMVTKTLKSKGYDTSNLSTRMMAVDNNPVFIENHLQILCSTYSVISPVNIPAFIPKHVFDSNTKDIINVLCSYYPSHIKPTTNYMKLQRYFYTMYIELLSENLRVKQETYHDSLFKVIKDVLLTKKVTNITPEYIQYMQRKINTKHH